MSRLDVALVGFIFGFAVCMLMLIMTEVICL